jgi:hypothetical protein
MSYLISGIGKKERHNRAWLISFRQTLNSVHVHTLYIKNVYFINKRTLPLSKQNIVCISSRNKLGMYELLFCIHKHAKQMSAVQTKLTKFMVHVELLEL